MSLQSNFTCLSRNNESIRLLFHCHNLQMNYPLYNAYKYSFLGVALFDFCLAPVAAISNLLILIAICRNKSLQTTPYCVIFSLALSDMITGFLTQPIKGSITLNIFYCKPICATHVAALQLSYSLGIVSFLSLSLITLERYVAIFYPYRYQEFTVDKSFIVKLIVAIWVLAAVMTGLSFLTYQMILQRVFAIVVIILSLVFSISAHVRIVRVVKRIQRQVIEQQSAWRDCQDQIAANSATNKSKAGINTKATRVAVSVLIAMFICYIPSGIFTTLRFFGTANDFIRAAHDWTQSFVLFNSSINPFLYCFQLSEMRRHVLDLVTCCKTKSVSTEQDATATTRQTVISM